MKMLDNIDHFIVHLFIINHLSHLSGKIVTQRNYDINGTVQLPIVTYGLDKGIYLVTLTIGNNVQQQKLIVQ